MIFADLCYKKCIFIVKTIKNIQVIHFQKKLILISKNKIKGKSKCTICLTERTFIDEIEGEYDLESELKIYFQFFVDWCYKNKMKTYCVKCNKDTDNIDPKIVKTKNGRLLMH